MAEYFRPRQSLLAEQASKDDSKKACDKDQPSTDDIKLK